MSKKECRICYDDEDERASPLISPCACDGTRRFVHRECIEEWRNVKRGRIDYLQCQECRQFYNIGKKYAIEELRFDFGSSGDYTDYCIIFAFNIIFWLMSPIITIFDTSYGVPTVMSIGDSTKFVSFLKRNNFETYCYYYSFIVFLFSFFSQMIIFIKIQCNIKNRMRYWDKALGYFIWLTFYNFNYYYLYLLTLDREYSEYCISSSVMNLFNILGLLYFTKKHNQIVRDLNSIDNEEYLKNYDQPRGRTSSFERNMILDVV